MWIKRGIRVVGIRTRLERRKECWCGNPGKETHETCSNEGTCRCYVFILRSAADSEGGKALGMNHKGELLV